MQLCSGEKTRIEKNNACGRSKAINISDIKECEEYRESLTISCLITVVLPEVLASPELDHWELEQNVKAQETLKDNFSNVIFNGAQDDYGKSFNQLSDIKIQCEDDPTQPFNCHKIVLTLRSPVFAAMLLNNYTESINNLIVVKDILTNTMFSLIKFMYTDTVNENEIDCDLLAAADKYQVLRLKAICERSIACKMTVNVAFKDAISSYLHGSDVFQREVVKYIGKNWAEISSTSSSEEIKKYPDLLHKVLSYVVGDTS